MKIYLVPVLLLFSMTASAHPNGVYTIDGDATVTVTFKFLKRCPPSEGAMKGGLRQLSFSPDAELEPYLFSSGTYVEAHSSNGESYVKTDKKCVPVKEKIAIPASRSSFGEYSLLRQ